MKGRTRRILRFPEKGGAPCEPLPKSEVVPCNTNACTNDECVNGEWAEWGDWGKCSATCEGGVATRSRHMGVEPNYCGKPAMGNSLEVGSCNVNVVCETPVPCKFGLWSHWSACSASCHGVHRRSRVIEVHAKATGKPCVGGTEEIWPCNPARNEKAPASCITGPPVDCKLSDYKVTKQCTATCGGGQIVWTRSIVQHASNGGAPCDATLEKTEACATSRCPTNCEPQDCVWSSWGNWSACDKCGGQKRRERHIVTHMACGGQPCGVRDIEEVTNCTRKCHEPVFCAWDDWESWSPCTATCDKGRRHRQRSLTIKEVTSGSEVTNLEELPEEALEQNLKVLSVRARSLEARRLQEIVVAFGAGLLTLVVLGTAFRAFSRRSQATSVSSGYEVVAEE